VKTEKLTIQSEIFNELMKSMTYLDLIEYIDFNSMTKALEFDKDSLVRLATEISIRNN
jgi:hypothetical protein